MTSPSNTATASSSPYRLIVSIVIFSAILISLVIGGNYPLGFLYARIFGGSFMPGAPAGNIRGAELLELAVYALLVLGLMLALLRPYAETSYLSMRPPQRQSKIPFAAKLVITCLAVLFILCGNGPRLFHRYAARDSIQFANLPGITHTPMFAGLAHIQYIGLLAFVASFLILLLIKIGIARQKHTPVYQVDYPKSQTTRWWILILTMTPFLVVAVLIAAGKM